MNVGAVRYENGGFVATATYTHDGSETTDDSFTHSADDGDAQSEVSTATIEVTPVNDLPIAYDLPEQVLTPSKPSKAALSPSPYWRQTSTILGQATARARSDSRWLRPPSV